MHTKKSPFSMLSLKIGSAKELAKEKLGVIHDDLEPVNERFRENRDFFENVLDVSRQMQAAYTELWKLGQRLESILRNHSTIVSASQSTMLLNLSKLQQDLNLSLSAMSTSAASALVEKFRVIVEVDTKTIKEMRNRYKSNRREYESLSKLERSSRHVKADDKVAVKQRYEHSRSAYLENAARFDVLTKQTAIESVYGYYESQRDFTALALAKLHGFDWTITAPPPLPTSGSGSEQVHSLSKIPANSQNSQARLIGDVKKSSTAHASDSNLHHSASHAKQQRELPTRASKEIMRQRNASIFSSALVPTAIGNEIYSRKPLSTHFKVQLDHDQLSLATYETFLLLSNYPFEHPDRWDDTQSLPQAMRIHFQISRKQFNKVTAWLKAPYAPFKPVVEQTLLSYRLHLVKTLDRSQFERDEEYMLWRERQLRVFQAGFSCLVQSDASSWVLQGKKISPQELIQQLDALISRALATPLKSTQEIESINQYIADVFQKTPFSSKSTSGHVIALPYPPELTDHLYSKMVGVVYDADSRAIQSQYSPLLQDFQKLRLISQISDTRHSVSVPSVLLIGPRFSVLIAVAQAVREGCTDNEAFREVVSQHSNAINPSIIKECPSLATSLCFELEAILLDFFATLLDAPTLFGCLIPLFISLQTCLSQSQSSQPLSRDGHIARCIFESARKHYEKLKEMDECENSAESIVSLAVVLEDEIEFGQEMFCSQVTKEFSKATSCMMLSFALPYFDDFADKVTPASFNASMASKVIGVQRLCDYLRSIEPQFESVDVEAIFDDWFAGWIKDQEMMLVEYATRIMQAEKWRPIGSSGKIPAVVDLTSMLAQYLPLYKSLCVFSVKPIVQYARIVERAIDLFVASAQDCMIPQAELIPEPVQILHYFINKQSKPVLIKRQGYPTTSERVSQLIKKTDVLSICIRCRSIAVFAEEVASMWKEIDKLPRTAKSDSLQMNASILESVNRMLAQLSQALKAMIDFIGVRIVFGDLRAEFLHGVYKPDPVSNPIRRVLSNLQDLVEEIGDLGLPTNLMQALMSSVEREFFRCLDLVLIDVEPSRKYFADQQAKSKTPSPTSQEACIMILDDDIRDAMIFFKGKEDPKLQAKWLEYNAMFSLDPSMLIKTFEELIKSKHLEKAERVAHIIIMSDHKDIKAYLKKLNIST